MPAGVKYRVTKRGAKKTRIPKGRHVGEGPYQHDMDTEVPHYTESTVRPGNQFGHGRRMPKKKKKSKRII